MKRFTVLMSILLLTCLAYGQTTKGKYYVFSSFVKTDTVLLRWVPLSPKLLRRGLKYGMVVERIDYSSSAQFENNKSLKTFPIAPFDSDKNQALDDNEELKGLVDGFMSAALKEDEEKYLYSILVLASGSSSSVSSILNLSYTDTDIETTKRYLYRVGIVHKYPKYAQLKVTASKKSKSKSMTELSGTGNSKRKEAFLTWEAESLQSDYSAYWIERSTDSVHFERINKTPYVFFKSSDESEKKDIDYVDKTIEEGNTYWYRIAGITHFAEIGGVSNTIQISTKRILKGNVQIDTIFAQGLDRNINGTYHSLDDSDQKKLKGFVLMKSQEMHSGFSLAQAVLQKDTNYQFKISSEKLSGDRNYFKVGAVSIDDDTVFSYTRYFFTLDQEPPSSPKNLSGIVDSNGIAALQWTINPEDDIQGYRVFRSNSLKEDFVEVTTDFVVGTDYYDTLSLNNLTSEVYYRIAAVDLNYNNSNHCEAVKLMKPDTIAPVACVFVNYKSESLGMSLTWNNSNSTDIASNQLFQVQTNGREKLLHTWVDSSSTYVDTTAQIGSKNTYVIRTIDHSENISDSKQITAIYETGKRPSIDSLSASIDLDEKSIILSWNNPSAEIYSIKIYRSKDDAPYQLLKTTKDFNSQQFIDKNLYINSSYSYKLKVVYQSGIKSEFSDVVVVRY